MTGRVRIDETMQVSAGGASVTVKADPLEIELDPIALGRGPADAIAETISEAIASSEVPASPGTIAKRKRQGITSTRKWNATGELARGIRSDVNGQGFDIHAPSDRLEDPALLEQLAADIPEVANPTDSTQFQNALEQSANAVVRRR